MELARNEVEKAKAAHKLHHELLKLREDKCTLAKASCEECLAIVEESVAIGITFAASPVSL